MTLQRQYSTSNISGVTVMYSDNETKNKSTWLSRRGTALKKWYTDCTTICGKIKTFLGRNYGLILFALFWIGNFVAIPLVDRALYDNELNSWSEKYQECQCKFELTPTEVIYCKDKTETIPLVSKNEKYFPGVNQTCYVNFPLKSIDSIQYEKMYSYTFADTEHGRSGIIGWLVGSITICIASILPLLMYLENRRNQ